MDLHHSYHDNSTIDSLLIHNQQPPAFESDYSPQNTHVKTYTAGEDGSRLAAAARELGLAQQRQPRKQVRNLAMDTNSHQSILVARRIVSALFNTRLEEMRMMSVTSHQDSFVEQREWTSIPHIETGPLDVIEEEAEDDRKVVGGTMFAATLGIIKGMVGCVAWSVLLTNTSLSFFLLTHFYIHL
jgi:hypothetical protein